MRYELAAMPPAELGACAVSVVKKGEIVRWMGGGRGKREHERNASDLEPIVAGIGVDEMDEEDQRSNTEFTAVELPVELASEKLESG